MREIKKIEREINRLTKEIRRQIIKATFTREWTDYQYADMLKKEQEKLNRKYYELKMRE